MKFISYPPRQKTSTYEIDINSEEIIVEDLIHSIVSKEIHEKKRQSFFITPRNDDKEYIEIKENGKVSYKKSSNIRISPPTIDIQVVFEAFRNHQFLLLVDNRPVNDLTEKLIIKSSTEIKFIKLTPLRGG